ncbi:MAG: AAA family ATPase, partial [Gammaproteobacteria bacterium]|nr:AAA family ATPase [Gammaproteobacteria bacterium]
MYESYYKLRDEPFRLSPDPYYSFKHRSYVQAEGYLRYGVQRAEGIVMVTGVPGTGKSTLVSDLLSDFPPSKLLTGTLVITRLETDDLFRTVAFAFNLSVEGMDRASVLRTLELFLTENAQAGKRALLIVDEAQNMSIDGLEDLRLLTNLQKGNRPLLQIFLLGQETLRDKVQDPTLKQLLQRIIAASHLDSLEPDEARDYIEQRLQRAGWQGDPEITNDAFILIHKYSSGIPRRINQICSRLFLYGSVDEKHLLDGTDVQAVLEDFRKELLLPADEQHDIEEISRAYTHAGKSGAKSGSYQPRVVSAPVRPVDHGKSDATRPPNAERFNRTEKAGAHGPDNRAAPERTNPERRRAAPPHLQSVNQKSPVNDALKSLENERTPPPSARPRPIPPQTVKQQQTGGAVRSEADRPSLFADPRDERRAPGPTVMRQPHRYDDSSDRYARTGSGRSWLTLLLALALLATSIYA